ncbi:MAG: VUT family protein, partial [Spirochaetales bacterium]|nr:VUT family protein [Spirochaetales bacterium]
SVIFTVAAFVGVFSLDVLLEIAVSTYILKVIVALADTPFIYLARRWKERNRIPA